jgi:hypothetical protein
MRILSTLAFTVLGCALLAIVAQPRPASAQDESSLIIAVMNCPDGYQGDTYAVDCTVPASGVDFTVATSNTDNTETTTSRGDGLATFSLAPYDLDPSGPDQVSVGEPATQTSDYAVECTKNGGNALDNSTETIDVQPGGPLLGITFSFDTGDNIGCNWYRIHRPMPGQTSSSGETGSQVNELPTTGTGPARADHDDAPSLLQLAILLGLAGTAALGLRPRNRKDRSSAQ